MLAKSLLDRFKKKSPVCLLARMSLTRLLSEDAMNRVFKENAVTQYDRTATFAAITQMMADVTLKLSPSVNAAYKKHKERLGVSQPAVLNKFLRVEPQVMQALVRYSYDEAQKIGNCLRSGDASDLTGYHTKILDGNHLSGSDHRIKELRVENAAALPGKSLVVLDPRLRLLADYFPIEDGHAQERTELDSVIETIEARDLWIADRNFCTLKFMTAIAQSNAFFVIRHHGRVGGDLGERRFIGTSNTGKVYERSMTLSSFGGTQLKLRRIEVELFKPTRDKEKMIVILTNVSKRKADALRIADIYLKRWKIETAFQVLTSTLRCEVNTLGYPCAALFAFATAMVAYNAIMVVEFAIRAEHDKQEADQLSKYYMALEITEVQGGMSVVLEDSDFDYLKSITTKKFCAEIREVARHVEIDRYRKSKRGPKLPVKKNKPDRRAVHVSVAKVLAESRG